MRIAVIGDVMIDQYYYGDVTRISPEAPVPIHHVREVKSVLGGAANVASNLANLGCSVYLGSVVGNDANYNVLESLLKEQHIDCTGIIKSSYRPTITKTRILSMGQQMIRLDFEEVATLYDDETQGLKQWFTDLLSDGIDAVFISDYAKGICTEAFCQWVIKQANHFFVPVLVDPKGTNWMKYVGSMFVTPNVKELSDAFGLPIANDIEEIISAGIAVTEKYPVLNLVVTRSEKGITLIRDKDSIIHSPAVAKEVFDVTGCGDTAAAVLLVAYLGGFSLKEALDLANCAAGIVVAKLGTYPIHREELLQKVLE